MKETDHEVPKSRMTKVDLVYTIDNLTDIIWNATPQSRIKKAPSGREYIELGWHDGYRYTINENPCAPHGVRFNHPYVESLPKLNKRTLERFVALLAGYLKEMVEKTP